MEFISLPNGTIIKPNEITSLRVLEPDDDKLFPKRARLVISLGSDVVVHFCDSVDQAQRLCDKIIQKADGYVYPIVFENAS